MVGKFFASEGRPMRVRAVMVVVLGVMLLSFSAGGLVCHKARRDTAENWGGVNEERLRQQLERDRRERLEDVGSPVAPTEEEAAEFRRVFDRLGKALADEDEDACAAAFNINRMTDELDRLGVFAGTDDRAAFMHDARLRNGKTMLANPFLRWEKTEIRRVRWSPDRREAVVIAFHRAAVLENRSLKVRWWLVDGPGGWKLFDFEEMDMGLRGSRVMASFKSPEVLREFRNNPSRILNAVTAIREAMSAINQRNDVDEADQKLQAARGIKLPPPIAAVQEMIEGLILMDRGAPEAALKRFDVAERLQPNMPVFNLYRANVAVAASRFDEGLRYVRKYLAEVGPDADAYATEGLALEGLDRFPEAANSYRKALDENPDLLGALAGLRRVLDNADKNELALRVGRAKQPLKAYDDLIRQTEDDIDITTPKVLNAWLRKAYPNDPRAISLEFDELIDAGKFDTAAAVLRERLKNPTSDDVKGRVLNIYLRAMTAVDCRREAYSAVPDDHAARAFELLADDIEDWMEYEPANAEPMEKALRDLIAAHRKRVPDDPSLWYHEGSILRRARKYAEAERAFAEGQAKLPKREKPKLPDPNGDGFDRKADRFRTARVECFYAMKQGLKAYAEVGPTADTFRQLAYSYDNDKDANGLEALVAAHRARSPDDALLKYWSAEVLYLREKYADAGAGFREFLRAVGDEAPFTWLARDNCVRSYLRANRPKDAREAIEEFGKERISTGLRAAVALADRRPADADAILAEYVGKNGSYVLIYTDEDFAKLIERPEFADLRKKYPNPPPTAKPAGPTDG